MNNLIEEKVTIDIKFLESKWFIISDEEKLKWYLKNVWMYRLTRYFNVIDNYKWANFDKIINAYVFDKELRFLSLQVIEMVEKKLKNLYTIYLPDLLNENNYKNSLHCKKDEQRINRRLIYIEQKLVQLKFNDIECKWKFVQQWQISAELFYDNLTFGELTSIFRDMNNELKI